MHLHVLGCSGSEAPGERTCSYLLGERTVFEMGCAASTLPIEDQARIDDVFLTHAHLDHVKDLAFFAENVFGRRATPVRVHASAATLEKVATHLLNGVIWPDFTRLPDAETPTLRYVPLGRDPVVVEGVRVSAVALDHPGGCHGWLLETDEGVLALCGDTGPTDLLWERLDALGERLRAIVLECSFPDRLGDLAAESGHLTPRTLAAELGKLARRDVPVYVHHIKAPTRAETVAELGALGEPRLRVLTPGTELAF